MSIDYPREPQQGFIEAEVSQGTSTPDILQLHCIGQATYHVHNFHHFQYYVTFNCSARETHGSTQKIYNFKLHLLHIHRVLPSSRSSPSPGAPPFPRTSVISTTMRFLAPTLALAGLISLTSATNNTAKIKHNTYNPLKPPGYTTTDGTCGQQSPRGATCTTYEYGNCCSCKLSPTSSLKPKLLANQSPSQHTAGAASPTPTAERAVSPASATVMEMFLNIPVTLILESHRRVLRILLRRCILRRSLGLSRMCLLIRILSLAGLLGRVMRSRRLGMRSRRLGMRSLRLGMRSLRLVIITIRPSRLRCIASLRLFTAHPHQFTARPHRSTASHLPATALQNQATTLRRNQATILLRNQAATLQCRAPTILQALATYPHHHPTTPQSPPQPPRQSTKSSP